MDFYATKIQMLVRILYQRSKTVAQIEKEVCPVCKSDNCITFSADSPDGYTRLSAIGYGRIPYLCGCLKCGNVFLPPDEVRSLNKWKKEKEEKNRK